MIKSLKSLFEIREEPDSAEVERRVQLAAAALLIEMTRADFVLQRDEQATLKRVLGEALSLSDEEINELVALARQAADKAVSLYEFTRLINDHYDKTQKLKLIENMWQVAFADGDLDKYEERLIRQVSDLIHVSHKDFIRLKLLVSSAAS
jgi:uncharacterized tellurite resistance protein B-like protein